MGDTLTMVAQNNDVQQIAVVVQAILIIIGILLNRRKK